MHQIIQPINFLNATNPNQRNKLKDLNSLRMIIDILEVGKVHLFNKILYWL